MEALLDLVALLISLRLVWRLLGGAIAGVRRYQQRTQPPSGAPSSGIQMERDPVCGTFVVPDRAVSMMVGSHRVYFCSAACRDQYRARTA